MALSLYRSFKIKYIIKKCVLKAMYNSQTYSYVRYIFTVINRYVLIDIWPLNTSSKPSECCI